MSEKPTGKLGRDGEDVTDSKVLISTCMKDEGPFILEWVAWHKAIGVDDIVVFTNDCTDGTGEILDRLNNLGEVVHLPNPALVSRSTFFQPVALAYTKMLPQFRSADYFISIDVDEFINVRIGNGHLNDLLKVAGNFDVLSISELNHGSNGHEHFMRGWVTDIFPNHQNATPGKWKALRGVKSVVRLSDKVENIRNHRPDMIGDEDSVAWLDGSCRPINALLNDASRNGLDCRGSYDIVTLNHYPLRSLESYLVKMFRGDVVVKGKSVSQRYWRIRNQNNAPTISFNKSQAEAARKYFDKLMEDSELASLHELSCVAHEQRIGTLLYEPEYVERKKWILSEAWD